jgi:hypothetical protein
MFSSIVSAVMRRVVLNNFDVADQPGTSVSALNQIMTKQSISRESAVEDTVQRVHLIDSLSHKDTFAYKS